MKMTICAYSDHFYTNLDVPNIIVYIPYSNGFISVLHDASFVIICDTALVDFQKSNHFAKIPIPLFLSFPFYLHSFIVKQTHPLWNEIHNALLILQSNNPPSSTASMSFDAKYNFTRFKISFRSGFSGSLQILYSLLYASALIYITPSHRTDLLTNQQLLRSRHGKRNIHFVDRCALVSGSALLGLFAQQRVHSWMVPADLEWRRTLWKAWGQARARNLLLLHHMLLHFHFEAGGFGTQGRSQTRIGWMWEGKIVGWYTEFLFEPSLPSWGGSEGYD